VRVRVRACLCAVFHYVTSVNEATHTVIT